MTKSPGEAVRSALAAIANYDAEALCALLTPEATVVFPDRPTYVGPEGARKAIAELASSYVDWDPEPITLVADGDNVAVEWTCTITDFGGSQARIDGCCIASCRDGAIDRLRMYFRPEDGRQ